MVRSRYNSRRRGFLLMDALGALAMLGAGVFLSMAFFRAEVKEVRSTHERFAALLIAESEIERLRTLPYERIPIGEGQPLELKLPSAKHLKEATGTLTVQEIAPGLKAATVRIHWSSPRGTPLRVELSSEFSRAGSQHEDTKP